MDPMTMFFVTAAAMFGAAVGSFLNVCIYRMPRPGLAVSRPARSFCPTCGEAIRAADNIPLLSWMRLGGRCRACRGPVSSRYFFIEALTALLFAVVVHRFLPLIVERQFSWAACVVYLALVSALIVAAFVDFDLKIIPDEITIGGMHLLPILLLLFPSLETHHVSSTSVAVIGGMVNVLGGFGLAAPMGGAALWGTVSGASLLAFVAGVVLYRAYRRKFLPDLERRFRDVSLAGVLAASAVGWIVTVALVPSLAWSPRGFALGVSLVGMLTGSVLVFLVGVIGTKVFRKPAMGFGDVKLMGLLGGVAGPAGAIAGFFIACLLGSAFGIGRLLIYRDRYLPFGPFLTMGCMALALWPDVFSRLVRWYLQQF